MIPECSRPLAIHCPWSKLYVETVQHALVVTGVAQMLFVASADHPAVRSGQNVNAPRAQGNDESVLHCILVEVQPNSAHR
jgi:hypothetical protein